VAKNKNVDGNLVVRVYRESGTIDATAKRLRIARNTVIHYLDKHKVPRPASHRNAGIRPYFGDEDLLLKQLIRAHPKIWKALCDKQQEQGA